MPPPVLPAEAPMTMRTKVSTLTTNDQWVGTGMWYPQVDMVEAIWKMLKCSESLKPLPSRKKAVVHSATEQTKSRV